MKNGVNVTEVTVVYCPKSPRERAVLIVTLRPGNYPTQAAQHAITDFLDALSALQLLVDV